MMDLAFAFDHPNYARIDSYQNVYLSSLKQAGHPAYDDLLKRGYGASITGDTFSTLSGDLITGLFNKETKRTAGPFRAGFSTDIQLVNTWVVAGGMLRAMSVGEKQADSLMGKLAFFRQ